MNNTDTAADRQADLKKLIEVSIGDDEWAIDARPPQQPPVILSLPLVPVVPLRNHHSAGRPLYNYRKPVQCYVPPRGVFGKADPAEDKRVVGAGRGHQPARLKRDDVDDDDDDADGDDKNTLLQRAIAASLLSDSSDAIPPKGGHGARFTNSDDDDDHELRRAIEASLQRCDPICETATAGRDDECTTSSSSTTSRRHIDIEDDPLADSALSPEERETMRLILLEHQLDQVRNEWISEIAQKRKDL